MSNKKIGFREEYARRSRGNRIKPDDVNGMLTVRTEFYKKELRQIIKSLFEIKCPDTWDRDYIIDTLITYGFIAVAEAPGVGVIAVRATLTGFNYMNIPSGILVAVPLIPEFERTIGEDCEIIFISRFWNKNFYTFTQLIDIYAEKLASADASIDVNLMNSRVAYIIEAETKAQAATIKSMYDNISEGEPLVVYRKEIGQDSKGLQAAFGNVKQNFIADLVQDEKRSIMNEFLTFIGINNANTDKKERLITNEVESNNVELDANTAHWRENLKICTQKINAMFPDTEFSIKLRFDSRNKVVNKNDTNRNNNMVGVTEPSETFPR